LLYEPATLDDYRQAGLGAATYAADAEHLIADPQERDRQPGTGLGLIKYPQTEEYSSNSG